MNNKERDIEYAVSRIAEYGKYVGKYFVDKNIKFADNSKDLFVHDFAEEHLARQKDYKKLILKNIKNLFSEDELKQADLSHLEDEGKGLIINISGHHGILNHPWVESCNIASHFDRLFSDNNKKEPIITLNCGNCSLNNMVHRRGFNLNGKRVNIFPKKEKNRLVYATPFQDLGIRNRAIRSGKHVDLSQEEMELLKRVDEMIDNIDQSGCERYSDQVTKLNHYLWPLMFDESKRDKVLPFFGLEHDGILIEYLLDFLQDSSTFIHSSLFDPDFRKVVLDHFRGQYSAWDENKQYGTHFFWHIDSQGVQYRLYLNDAGELEASNGYRSIFEVEPVLEELRAGNLIPGMFLKFSTVICYLGVIPLAGFGSVNYLSTIRSKWIEILPEEFKREKELINSVKTDKMVTIPNMYKYDDRRDVFEEAYAFDLIYKGGLGESYLKKLERMSVPTLMRTIVPFAYEYYTGMYARQEDKIDLELDREQLIKPIKEALL